MALLWAVAVHPDLSETRVFELEKPFFFDFLNNKTIIFSSIKEVIERRLSRNHVEGGRERITCNNREYLTHSL